MAAESRGSHPTTYLARKPERTSVNCDSRLRVVAALLRMYDIRFNLQVMTVAKERGMDER